MSKIDPINWDPPEYLPRGDQQFLINRASTMHKIQGAAWLSMGQILIQVREKFKSDSKLDGWWTRWIEEATPLDISMSARCIKIAQSVREVPEFKELCEKIAGTAADAISRLPKAIKRDLILAVLESGERLTIKDG